METHVLQRSGMAPLRFEGELVAESSSKHHEGPLQSRWHTLAVYRTAGGNYVASVRYRSCWQGEMDRDYAEVFADPEAVRRFFEVDHDPLAYYLGGPRTTDELSARDDRIRQAIKFGYQMSVTEILAEEAFHEKVE